MAARKEAKVTRDKKQFTKDQLILALQSLECSGDTPIFIGDSERPLHHVRERSHTSIGKKRTVLLMTEE
jgi:hypothetical protein